MRSFQKEVNERRLLRPDGMADMRWLAIVLIVVVVRTFSSLGAGVGSGRYGCHGKSVD